MTTLQVAILGLNRVGASFGLALKRYARNGGKYSFHVAGYDTRSFNEKAAHKADAIDRIDKSPENAVREAQIVLLNLPYEDIRKTYRLLQSRLREGVVILDASAVKLPSQQWAKEFLTGDQHMVGFSPLPAARYLESASQAAEDASADYFDGAPCLVVPAADSLPEAVDLAYNIALLLGAKPRFVDPQDYDSMFALTEQLPRLLGLTLFYHLTHSESWADLKYFTGVSLALSTQALNHEHPDTLREHMLNNRAVLARALDGLITHLTEVRDALNSSRRDTVEALLTQTATDYEQWLGERHRVDWDRGMAQQAPEAGGMLSLLVGDRLARRLTGRK